MKTRYPKLAGCVPKSSLALKANALSEYYHRNDILIELDDGSIVKSGHVAADGRRFNFRDVYDTQSEWGYAHLTQLSYNDPQGNHQVIDLDPRHPATILKNRLVTTFGYATKVNGLRWGVTVHLDWNRNTLQVITDQGSPITGALIQLI